MKNKTMRSAAVMLTAALTVTCLTGCSGFKGNGGGNGGNSGGKKGSLNLSFDHAYAGEKVEITGIEYPQAGLPLGDNILIVGADKNYEEAMVLYHPADGTTKPVEFAYMKNAGEGETVYPNSYFIDSDGNFNILYNSYKSEVNEDGEEIGGTSESVIETYDMDFNVVQTRSVADAFGEDFYINRITANPQGGYIISAWDENVGSETAAFYDKDFQKTGEVKANFQYLNGIYTTKKGDVFIAYDDNEGTTKFGTLNVTTGEVTPMNLEGQPRWFNECFASEDDAYDLYLYDSEYIYGINAERNVCEPVVNWLNSDFLGNYVGEVVQLPDGRFMLGSNTIGKESTTEVWVLSPRDPDDFKDVKMITMAGLYIPDEVSQSIMTFNRTHSDVRIAVENYEKYSSEEDYDAGLKKFKNDMTSGIVADMILTNGLPYESFANKGLFLDLSDRISAYSDADYFTSFFDALRYGDKLYHLGFSYSIETIEGKTSVVGDKQGLTAAEFMQLIKSLPSGTKAFGEMSKSSALYTLISMNVSSFVDYNASTCNFNVPEFKEMLEFCNTFPSDEEMSKTYEENQNYWADQQYQYINGNTALQQTWISNLRYGYQQRMTSFDKEPVTRVGYPVSQKGGNGGVFNTYDTIAISANSDCKDECWDFMSSMLSEEYQESLSWSMPISRKAFDKMAEEAKKPETYRNENGEEVETPFTIWRGEEEVKIPNMPQSYADEVKAYIEGIRDVARYDGEIMEIINEETEKFFSGDQTSEQAVNMIQSRASLYLSEQA